MKISVIFMNEKFCRFHEVTFYCKPFRVSYPTPCCGCHSGYRKFKMKKMNS